MTDFIYYGNSLRDWGISALIVVVAFILNRLIGLLFRRVIRRWTAKTASRIDDVLFDALEKPVAMGIFLLAIWIAAGRLQLGGEVQVLIGKSCDVLVVLNVTWFFARFFSSLIVMNLDHGDGAPQKGWLHIDGRLLPVVRRGALIIVWLIGAVTALHQIGVTVTALIGTLGIGGIAFALAAQDTIKNIFGGITIFTDRTFRIGDVISFDATEGTVVDIGLRSTRICTYDRRFVTIPNYKLTDALITNISSEPGRRVVMDLGLTYDTTPEKLHGAIALLRDMPHRVPGVRSSFLSASFFEFGDSALIIRFIYFIRKSADIMDTRSKVNFDILTAFTQAGLNFAFPSRTVYFGDTPPTS